MFCPECGHELQEGHAFCKYCGARLDDDAATAGAAPLPAEEPGAPAVAADTTLVTAPSGDADTTLVAAPVAATAEVAASTSPAPPTPPPLSTEVAPNAAGSPPPNNTTKVLLIVAAAVLGVLILGGAAFALFFATGSKTTSSDAGSTVTALQVVATGTTSSGTATTGTTVVADTTTLTVPSYHPGDNTGTVPTTTPGGDITAPAAYLENLDRLDSVLSDADGKVLAIADKINATTPNIPTSVLDDLATVSDDVMSSYDWLAADTAPPGYEKAHDLILQAGDAMISRIDKTNQGVIEIDRAGTTDAGKPFFADAKTAKDQFTKLYAEYQRARP